jgi:hypothetical protein
MAPRIFLSLLVTFLCVSSGWSQRASVPDAGIENWFDHKIGVENSGLINGQQYKMKMFGAKTNPFFEEGEAPGTVHFNHHLYNATVLYDTYQDVLVVKHFSQGGTVWFVQLDKISVEGFSIRHHVFRKFNDSFYEVLFDANDLLVLSKRSKIQTLIKGVNSYVVNDEFFLVHSGQWSRLSSAGGMTALLDDKNDREKVKLFIKEKRISNRKFSDEDLVNLATYVSSLQHNQRTP